MQCDLIMTVLGPDRPGLVGGLAETVAAHGGNWLESRMAHLAGQFAGIVRVQCPESAVEALSAALVRPGLNIQIVRDVSPEPGGARTLTVEVIGNDRPGIVRELATAIAGAGGNVEELITGLESAPMSGQPMFRAKGRISLAQDAAEETLRLAIEQLGADLTVDLQG